MGLIKSLCRKLQNVCAQYASYCSCGLVCELDAFLPAEFVCKLDQMVGSCASFTTRWWFNAGTGNCEEYSYSGCQGNANNFGEYTDCQSFCKDTRGELGNIDKVMDEKMTSLLIYSTFRCQNEPHDNGQRKNDSFAFSVEPKCIQGKARIDSNSNYILCGGSTGQISSCPINHYCYFDGNTYGCCPNQGLREINVEKCDDAQSVLP